MRNQIILVLAVIVLLAWQGYCQDIEQLLEQVTKVYTDSEASGNSLIGGFSLGGLIGVILFGSIGFVAFIYGKRNSELKPMLMGVALMGYPYFVRNTIALYLIGVVVTVSLFVFRE